MGHIIHYILTGKKPFPNLKDEIAYKTVMEGGTPWLEKFIINSTDPAIQALHRAMMMCWTFDPKDRPSARVVQHFLSKALATI